ncbi:MAG: multicopper oxidase domain-containing protein [Chloroflexi bacterium]|nr:multicopper oxidase domain-containing protein [Chloroflexota bacterium]
MWGSRRHVFTVIAIVLLVLGMPSVAGSQLPVGDDLANGELAPPAGARNLTVLFFNDGPSFNFVPGRITIVKGDTLTLANHDTFAHRLVLRLVADPAGPASFPQPAQPVAVGQPDGNGLFCPLQLGPLGTPVLQPMESYSHTFTAPGVYEVFDPALPEVTGRIVVEDKETLASRNDYIFSQTFATLMAQMMPHDHQAAASAAEVARSAQAVVPKTVCPFEAPVRSFNVMAIDVTITLNRFGDRDPEGKMYVLEQDMARVRAQEREPLPRVSTGLRDDPIQPLVIRANLGDCVRVNFRNGLSYAAASMHIHRALVSPAEDGSAVGNNPDSTINPGQTTTYTWFIENLPEMEGAVYFHSHGDTRDQTAHGLFGALIAEPPGAVFLHPDTLEPLDSGWEAVIQTATEPTFREFTIIYHEIGDETYRPLDMEGNKLPLNDPETGVYRPCTRAINYRSECFMRRMELGFDESMGYSSYTYGDPATPMPRSYLGDPYKTRLVHGGSEVFHSHHHHGGTVRWPLQPEADPAFALQRGLDKTPPINTLTQRLDVQAIGPGEIYNLEHECASGGCQQVAGDFLYHCHFPHHYVAGMWSFYRVFNTLQPDLRELPSRQGHTAAPVNSLDLLGKSLPSGTVLTADNLEAWVESQLPPQGARQGYDATVWDWVKEIRPEGPLYLSEPEDTRSWPNFTSPTPGERREVLFDPKSGRPAYPLLTPHLGKRPPFAPGAHGPAPYLTTSVGANSLPTNSDFAVVPADTERPRDTLCPAGSPVKRYNVVAITRSIAYNTFGDVDRDGQIFVLAEDVEDVLAGRKPAQPLVIRANVRDCVYVTLTSRLVDNKENEFLSKVNMHPHFFQFDVQATDGVITGLAFEQSVRPFPIEGRALRQGASRGEDTVSVTHTRGLRPGIWLGVGLGTKGIELHRIAAIDGNTVRLTEPLVRDHSANEAAGVEFVQYAWYPDVNLGTVFWHDHAFGATSWGHGLFGTTIVEPRGSTYLDPRTGLELRSGPIADIYTADSVAIDLSGQSYREMVLLLQDTAFDGASSFNLRREPLEERLKRSKDASLLFSSVTHGDPVTPLLRAYKGDPVVIRLLEGGTNEVQSFRITGHRFRLERFPDAALKDSLHIAIAERFDPILEGGAGQAGDYLYYNPEADHLEDGMWGIFRVHDRLRSDLRPLPDRPAPPVGTGFPSLARTGGAPPRASDPGNPCPPGAPVRRFDVVALETDIVFNREQGIKESNGKVFVMAQDERDVASERNRADPLVLRASAGDCIEATLSNRTDEPVSLHLGKLISDPQRSLGITVGYNFNQSAAARGGRMTYRYYADRELGAGLLADFSGGIEGLESGLYGAIVVSPQGSRFFDPVSGNEVQAGWQAIVRNNDPAIKPFRDFTLIFQDQEPIIGKNVMPYKREPDGITAINYRTEPLEDRLKRNSDPSLAYSSRVHGEPETPVLHTFAGDEVQVHAVLGFGYQAHVFSISGYYWRISDSVPGSNLLATRGFAPHNTIDVVLHRHGDETAGDYLYGDHRLPFMEAGAWGIFRVHGTNERGPLPLAP